MKMLMFRTFTFGKAAVRQPQIILIAPMRLFFLLFIPALMSAQDTVKVGLTLSAEEAAESEYAKAITALKTGQNDSAVAGFTRALKLNPALDKALAGRSVAQSALRNFNDALADINQAIALKPVNGDHFFNKSLIFSGMGRRDSQEVALDRCLQLNGEHADAAYYKGLIAFERKDYEKAAGYYSVAIMSKRDFVSAYNDRGSARRAMGDIKSAIADYEKALYFDSTLVHVLNNLGSAYRLDKGYDKAIQYHTAALRRDPSYKIAYLNRGAAWFEKNEMDKARADFEKVLELDPRNSLAYNNLASIAIRNKDFTKARELSSRAIELDPTNGTAYHNRAIARQMLRDEDGCCQDWKKASELGVITSKSYFNASCIH
jgi:tetratricopeptide (TPR) repeat protein